MQIAQLYLGMWMAGGVLALGSLLIGNYGLRPGEAFSPSVWVSAAAAGLTLAGLTGIYVLGAAGLHEAQLGSLVPSLGVGAVAALCTAWMQRRAAAEVLCTDDSPGTVP